MRLECIAVAVVRPEVPVDVPDVVAPADQLADVALDPGQRGAPRAVGLFGGVGAVQGIQQAQVHGCRQQAVRHDTIAGEHGVLVRTEVWQAIPDEHRERGPGFGRRDGEFAGPVAAHEGDLPVALPAVEVRAHLLVDLVLDGCPRRG